MLLYCHSLLNSQNISMNNSEKGLLTRTPPTQLKKLQKYTKKGAITKPMMTFYPQWKGNNNLDGVQLQNQKHKIQSNIFKTRATISCIRVNVNHQQSVHLSVQSVPQQLSKQISKLFFKMSAQVYYVPGQSEGRKIPGPAKSKES